MKTFPRPIVAVSRCLEQAACRYDGKMIRDDFVRMLGRHARLVPVCPEVAIGLGVPRDPIRIVVRGGKRRLLQPSTGTDVTKAMARFSEEFLETLGPVDGVILKSRSPSCGIGDVKLYPAPDGGSPIGRGSGMFAERVLAALATVAVEDEERLLDSRIREHFLTRLFAAAALRGVRTAHGLVRFHAAHKLLLLAHHPGEYRRLGRIVARAGTADLARSIGAYARGFSHALARPAGRPSTANALLHAFGYFSKRLTARQKRAFLKVLERYRLGQAPLNRPVRMLRTWWTRFPTPYLAQQALFDPFPPELIAPANPSGRSTRRRAPGRSDTG